MPTGIKLTIETINIKLATRYIKIIGSYINQLTKTHFKCLKCEYIWTTAYKKIGQGSGCPKCAGVAPLSKEIINNERLVGRNITMIGCFKNVNTNSNFLCDICFYEWSATANNVLSGTGCPKCANNIKYTKEIINEQLNLQNKNIELIGNYISMNKKSIFRCKLCSIEFNINVSNVFHGERDCSFCDGTRLNTSIVNTKLKLRNIIMVDEYTVSADIKQFKCLVCNYIWPSKPDHILNGGRGCPECSFLGMNEKLTHSILKQYFDNIFHDYNIQKIDSQVKFKYELDFYLLKYNYIIEYNGIQHYKATTFGGCTQDQAELNLQKQQIRDQFVDKWARERNINIIWIDGRIYKGDKLKIYLEEIIIPQILGHT